VFKPLIHPVLIEEVIYICAFKVNMDV